MPISARKKGLLQCLWLVTTVVVGTSGCRALIEQQETAVPGAYPIPSEFSEPSKEGAALESRWWKSLDDRDLNELIAVAIERNPGLKQTWARLDMAEAAARQARSRGWPSVEATAGASRRRQRFDLDEQELVFTQSAFDASMAASFELDVWGRARALAEAGELDRQATAYELDAAAITLTASVTESWYDLVAARAGQDLMREQREAGRRQLEVTELRFREGVAPSLDVRRQRLQVEQLDSQLRMMDARVKVSSLALQALLGGPVGPEGPALPEKRSLSAPPARPRPGIPSEVLTRRPDLSAQRARLEAGDRRVAAAVAARMPTIRLSAEGGFSSTSITEFFATPVWALMSGLTAPLFRGGELAARVDEQAALRDEALWVYVELLMEAAHEVEQAIAAELRDAGRIEDLEAALCSARSILDETSRSYAEGLVDYTQVHSALETLQTTERELLDARREALSSRVRLHRALAGSWSLSEAEE